MERVYIKILSLARDGRLYDKGLTIFDFAGRAARPAHDLKLRPWLFEVIHQPNQCCICCFKVLRVWCTLGLLNFRSDLSHKPTGLTSFIASGAYSH